MLKIHETITSTGATSLVHLTIDGGVLAVVVDGETLPLGEGALEAVLARFGASLEPAEPLIAVGALDLGEGRAVRHVRHLALYDVIARDFLVYGSAGAEALCALATTVAGALDHLARATGPSVTPPAPRTDPSPGSS
jgi:hypothetical protein